VANRPHLVLGAGAMEDPDFRQSPVIGFNYVNNLGDTVPMAWKSWAAVLYDAPITMHYSGLNRRTQYKVRVVYSGDAPHKKIRLVANGDVQVHTYMLRAWPPAPQEFSIPAEATANGELNLSWTCEPGLGGNGRGCQVAEVWLFSNNNDGGSVTWAAALLTKRN
jgi:hypothetical protein